MHISSWIPHIHLDEIQVLTCICRKGRKVCMASVEFFSRRCQRIRRGRRPPNPCSRSCTGFQCNNVWPTRPVFWCTRPCRRRNRRICTPYWLLTNQLDACDRRNIPCWPRDISTRQQPRERSGIPHLIPGIDWLWILVVKYSVLLKNF